MDLETLKLYGINSATLLVTYTNLEMWLKIILLVSTIAYTLMKIRKLYREEQNDKKL